jgi:Tfp pilus assembly protein PilF
LTATRFIALKGPNILKNSSSVEEIMQSFGRNLLLPRVAALAVALAWIFVGPSHAEDAPAAPQAESTKPPVLTPVEPPQVGETVAPSASGETEPCFTGKGSIKEVLDSCAAIIASGETDKDKLAAAHGNRALGFSATRDFDAAIAELDKAIELKPEVANLYLMRGAANRAKQDLDKALVDIDKAISIDANKGDFYTMRGMIYADKGDLDKAIAELGRKIELDPKQSQGYSKRAEFLRMKKDYDGAVADYSEVIKRDPDLAKGFVDRGWIYVLKGDLDKAEADFAAALKLHDNDASALVGRGVVKSRKGKPTDGSADISFAIKLEPGIVDEIKKLGIE